MLLNELFRNIREAAPTVGRKYQHIEDLIFTGIPSKGINPGSEAGLQAVRILNAMGSSNKSLELKWDGSPVVYWGRDEQGRFSMIPKNAWEYLKRGKTQLDNGAPTVMYKPEDISSFILGTGKAEPEKEQQRKAYAGQLASLWPYLESVSPQKGYLEGGILFWPGLPPTLNQQTGEYDFKPNESEFHIPANSKLGQRIKNAKVMIAATGYYPALGSSDETRFPNAEQLSTPDVIVQGTSYVEKAPGVESALLNKAEQFISSNGAAIDAFIAPKPGLTKVGDILYKFYNQNLRIAGVKEKFVQWAQTNLSAAQANKVISDPGLDSILTAVELLGNAKMDIYQKASAGTHGDIRQTKPEGYVYQDPETGQFVKAIDQANWAPRKN